MKFVVRTSHAELKASRIKRPFIGLVSKDWDDWGWRTLHFMYVFGEDGGWDAIGEIKILGSEAKITKLGDTFSSLDETYISLGQKLDFYKNLADSLDKAEAIEVLEQLNDIAIKPGLADASVLQLGLANSLLRSTEAKEARHWGFDALKGKAPAKDFKFEYTCQFKGADAPLATKIDFTPDKYLPWRMIGIIGQNGVGKTQFLGNLARDLAPPTRELLSERAVQKLEDPFSTRPAFSRIVALSFSAFDQFSKPQRSEYFSYIYCGARDDNGRLSNSWLRTRFVEYMERIEHAGNTDLWKRYLREIAQNGPWKNVDEDDDDGDSDCKITYEDWDLANLSSGQSIIAYSVAAVIAYLQPRSLLLFDEPELHLHPAAVSKFVRILYELLDHFKSYAIVTTHSLIVTQEIPRKNIRVFDREGNVTTSRKLMQESFGRNLEELSDLVFGNTENEQFYKKVFTSLADDFSFDEIVSLFDKKLSINALAYLSSLYNDEE